MTNRLETIRDLYHSSKDKMMQDFFTFLRFESVSSEKDHQRDVQQCAAWLAHYIEEMGFEVKVWETSKHPVLFASYNKAGPGKPTLLIYNHYDVQPVDPLDLWKSPPFEATVREGEIYARGAQDNKGQCFYVLQALKLLLQRDGTLPINIKLCIEGEEEMGSEGLSEILSTKQADLRADYLAIVDLGIQKPNKPAISLGTRGIVTMDVDVEGSKTDLHSGFHGGIVYNPLHALVGMLSKLRDEEGKVTIPGFYDQVVPTPNSEKARLSLDFDPKAYFRSFGAIASGGEKHYSPLESAWLRPTLEINGIIGGYTGSGFKTVIPAKAHAKISCRLVPRQDPARISKLVADYIASLAPEGIAVKVHLHPGGGPAARSEISSEIVQAFAKAYEEVFGSRTEFIFQGGSIPIISKLQEASGTSLALVGVGLPDDQIHAPNEHFGIDRLEKGCLIMARTIELLGEVNVHVG